MRIPFFHKINALHESANPGYLLASVQGASTPDAIDLAGLTDNLENKQLTWLARKNTVLAEIREELAAMESPEARRTAIVTLLDGLDALIEEDCLNVEMLRRYFRHAEKKAKKVSRYGAKRIHELGQRVVALAIRQIEAFADVGDHLRALMHHYEEITEKRPDIHITLGNAATPAQLRALLVSPSTPGTR